MTLDTPRPAAEAPAAALDVIGAGQYLGGVSRGSIYRLIKAGELRPVKIRGRTVILRADLDEYLSRQRQKVS